MSALKTPETTLETSPDTSLEPSNNLDTAVQEAVSPNNTDQKVDRMGSSSIPMLILEFAVPSIVGMLVNGAYNVIDSIFLGQAMGEIGLSTATVANPIMTCFMALAILVGNGGNALCALRLGQGRKADAEKTLGNTVTLALVFAVVIALSASNGAILDVMLTLSSATDEVRPYAESFIRIICFGFIFQCVGMGVNNFIRTAGAPNRALLTMVIGAVFCTLFNYLFVMCLGWGVRGSALATVLGQATSAVSVLWYFTRTKNVPLKLTLRNMKPDGVVLTTILSLGFASFVLQVGMAVVNVVINHVVVVYGAVHAIGAENALAAIGVVQRVAIFTVLPLIGIAIAIQPLLGYNYGAGLIKRVRATLAFGIGSATALGVVMWLFVELCPWFIVSAFGITNEELVVFTVHALRVQLLFLPFIAAQIVTSNYFQATGQPTKSIVLSLTRQIIFLIPLLIVFPMVLPQLFSGVTGLDGVYYAAPVSDAMATIAALVALSFELRRLGRIERGEISGTFKK